MLLAGGSGKRMKVGLIVEGAVMKHPSTHCTFYVGVKAKAVYDAGGPTSSHA